MRSSTLFNNPDDFFFINGRESGTGNSNSFLNGR